jgi:hypothetical protein
MHDVPASERQLTLLCSPIAEVGNSSTRPCEAEAKVADVTRAAVLQ